MQDFNEIPYYIIIHFENVGGRQCILTMSRANVCLEARPVRVPYNAPTTRNKE